LPYKLPLSFKKKTKKKNQTLASRCYTKAKSQSLLQKQSHNCCSRCDQNQATITTVAATIIEPQLLLPKGNPKQGSLLPKKGDSLLYQSKATVTATKKKSRTRPQSLLLPKQGHSHCYQSQDTVTATKARPQLPLTKQGHSHCYHSKATDATVLATMQVLIH